MAHVSDRRLLRRRELGWILDADIHPIGKQGLDFLTDAQNRSRAFPNQYFCAVLAALDTMLDDNIGMIQSASRSCSKSVFDILRSLDARNATRAAETSIRLKNQREPPKPLSGQTRLIQCSHNFKRSGVISNSLPVASHRSLAGRIGRGFLGNRWQIKTGGNVRRSADAYLSHADHAIYSTIFANRPGERLAVGQVDRQRMIASFQSRSPRILICDQSYESRFPGGTNRWNVIASTSENENALGRHERVDEFNLRSCPSVEVRPVAG